MTKKGGSPVKATFKAMKELPHNIIAKVKDAAGNQRLQFDLRITPPIQASTSAREPAYSMVPSA